MKKFNFSRLVVIAFVITLFSFIGCKPDPEIPVGSTPITPVEISADDAIIGVWSCTYDNGYVETYTITNTTFDAGEYSYAGDNLKVIKSSETSGYIYIKYTKSMNADYSFSSTAPDVGKWYALHYKNLTATSIKLSGAWKADGVSSTDTIDEAIKEFTVANGYFGAYSELTKVQ